MRHDPNQIPNYNGGKPAIVKMIMDNYKYPENPDENGSVLIRFTVNCHGETGNFVTEEKDGFAAKIDIDDKITNQLLNLTKRLDGWAPCNKKGMTYDYNQYLNFVIKNGQVDRILP